MRFDLWNPKETLIQPPWLHPKGKTFARDDDKWGNSVKFYYWLGLCPEPLAELFDQLNWRMKGCSAKA